MADADGEVTRLLERWREGDPDVLENLIPLVYGQLHRIAKGYMRHEREDHTLQPTALVNEAWLKLSKSPGMKVESPLHFKRIAARAMRQLLVEAARRRHADKRGGEAAIFVTFDEAMDGAVTPENELLALDSALLELAHAEPRQAVIVESRFFGGLEVREISELIGVSEATVLRDWRSAKAWLGHRLRETR